MKANFHQSIYLYIYIYNNKVEFSPSISSGREGQMMTRGDFFFNSLKQLSRVRAEINWD